MGSNGRVLPSRPARDHRAARNQARWLTEVGRLHPAHGDNPERTPLYILRGLEKGKHQQENQKNLWETPLLIQPVCTIQLSTGFSWTWEADRLCASFV